MERENQKENLADRSSTHSAEPPQVVVRQEDPDFSSHRLPTTMIRHKWSSRGGRPVLFFLCWLQILDMSHDQAELEWRKECWREGRVRREGAGIFYHSFIFKNRSNSSNNMSTSWPHTATKRDGSCGHFSACKYFLSEVTQIAGTSISLKKMPSWRSSCLCQRLQAALMEWGNDIAEWLKGFGMWFPIWLRQNKTIICASSFLKRLFSELFHAWSLLQHQGTILACHNYRSVHHHSQPPISLNSFPGKGFF